MKSIAVFLFFCLNWTYVFTQSRKNRFSPADLTVKTYSLKKQEDNAGHKAPFSKIRVIDARFDTSKLGFITNPAPLQATDQFKILRLKNGIATSLENYYNDHFDTQSNHSEYELSIVLKKFWITSTRSYDYQKHNSTNIISGQSRIIAKWELYIVKQHEYLPFMRLDTTIESLQSVKQLFKDENASYYNKESIYSILNNFIERYNYTKAIQVFNERKKLSLSEIMTMNNARLNLAVLNAESINTGVYVNFTEFKNNTPSIQKFSEKKVTKTLLPGYSDKYITDNNDIAITKYFAYSNKYTKIGPYGNETIFRVGNSFEFFRKIDSRSADIRLGLMNINTTNSLWIPYQLDMESGQFY